MPEASIEFRYSFARDWPPLTWLARCQAGSPVVTRHGAGVETSSQWFCEAVWDGDFLAGDFDLTDIVAGSGGRVRSDRLMFVSSGSTVDRLHHHRCQDDSVYVSNSLACLVAACGLRVEPIYRGYEGDFRSIVRGLTAVRPLATNKGDVVLTYFSNLQWSGSTLTAV